MALVVFKTFAEQQSGSKSPLQPVMSGDMEKYIMRVFLWRRWKPTNDGTFGVYCVNIEHHDVIVIYTQHPHNKVKRLNGKVVLNPDL